MFFDMHMDIWTNATWEYEKGNKDIIRKKFRDKFIEGNMLGGISVIWLDEYENPEARFQKMLRVASEEAYHSRDFIKIVKEVDDFEKAQKENKFAIIFGIEGLAGIGKKLDYLYQLERMGVRHIGLTWNETNDIATGQSGDKERGITELGKEAVKIMEELKIMIDVSHANDKSFWDMVKYAKKPFFASHSNARSLCPSMRNLTDDQLLAIKDVNGLVGMNAYHNFVSQNENEKTLDHLLNHLEYVAEKIGIDKVGFGFDFADYYEKETPEKGDLINLRDARDLNNIAKALKNRGYSQEDIDKVTYKNFIEFMRRVRA